MVVGVLSLLMHHGDASIWLSKELSQNTYLMPLLILVPAIIGFALQQTSGKAKKKSGGGGSGGGESK